MYRVIAGIDTYDDAPGYKHIRIMPHIGGNLSYVNAGYKTNYGTIRSQWKTDNSNLQLDVEIPSNTTATIYIPAANADEVKESNNMLSKVNGRY